MAKVKLTGDSKEFVESINEANVAVKKLSKSLKEMNIELEKLKSSTHELKISGTDILAALEKYPSRLS